MDIEFNQVSIAYDHQAVVKDLTLHIPMGEIFALLGSNGAGKSSSLKAMLDFIDIAQGHIRIRGIDHRQAQARRCLVYVPEKFSPPYYYTGQQFIDFTLAAHQAPKEVDRLAHYCQLLNLEPDCLKDSIKTYSKGMAQKLGLIAALASNKAILVLDEPMSGLDPTARARLRQLFGQLKAEGRTVLMCTHMLHDVEDICDRVGILHDRQLRFVGTAQQCREQFNADSLDKAFLRATGL